MAKDSSTPPHLNSTQSVIINTNSWGWVIFLSLVGLVLGLGLGMNLGKLSSLPKSNIQACTEEAKMCADGSSVGRTGPYCEFELCPEERSGNEMVGCPADAMMCPDGSSVGRSGPNCEFDPCPDPVSSDEAVMCAADVLECPDGSFVSRVGPRCEFAACPY